MALTKGSAIGLMAGLSVLVLTTCASPYMRNNGIPDPVETVMYSPVGYGCGCNPGMVYPSNLGGLGLLLVAGSVIGLGYNALTGNLYQRSARRTPARRNTPQP